MRLEEPRISNPGIHIGKLRNAYIESEKYCTHTQYKKLFLNRIKLLIAWKKEIDQD